MGLMFGYLGEIGYLRRVIGFIGGMCGWAFILFEIFAGEAGGTAADCTPAVASSFNKMRLIVTLGWAIYPAGYLCGLLFGDKGDVYLNVVYNIADFVNKIAFVLSCWSCAKADTEKGASGGRGAGRPGSPRQSQQGLMGVFYPSRPASRT